METWLMLVGTALMSGISISLAGQCGVSIAKGDWRCACAAGAGALQVILFTVCVFAHWLWVVLRSK